MTKVIEATNPDGNMENSPNACPCKYKENKTDFVRAVLCALLISMLFSFVASNVTLEKTAPAADSLCAAFKLAFSCIVDFVKELSQLASTRTGRHVLFARVWIVFYFGYLLDDYLQICEAPSDSGKWHRKCITGAWTFFLGQAFTIWCMKLSAVLGIVGLIVACVAVGKENRPRRQKWTWWIENLLLGVASLSCFCTAQWAQTPRTAFSLLLLLGISIEKICSSGRSTGRGTSSKTAMVTTRREDLQENKLEHDGEPES